MFRLATATTLLYYLCWVEIIYLCWYWWAWYARRLPRQLESAEIIMLFPAGFRFDSTGYAYHVTPPARIEDKISWAPPNIMLIWCHHGADIAWILSHWRNSLIYALDIYESLIGSARYSMRHWCRAFSRTGCCRYYILGWRYQIVFIFH